MHIDIVYTPVIMKIKTICFTYLSNVINALKKVLGLKLSLTRRIKSTSPAFYNDTM